MAYIPEWELTLPLLGLAVTLDDEPIPEAWLRGAAIRYDFWPWIEEDDGNGCEPDALLRLDGSEAQAVIF